MQFSSVVLAGAALTVAHAAQFTMTSSQFLGLKTGTPIDLTWSNATGPVTILLKNGLSNNLQTVETVTSGQTGTSYTWTPESTLPSGNYAFEIDDEGTPNYSVQFNLAGSASASLSSSTASSTTSASSTSSASSTTSSVSSSTGSTISSSHSSSATAASNSTSSTGSSASKTSSSKTTSTGSSSSGTTTPTALNSAAGLASPLAFVVLAFAAMMTFN